MDQQTAPPLSEPDESSQPIVKQRPTSPLVAPGELAIRAAVKSDARSLHRELLLGDLARQVLNDLEPRALSHVAVETIGRGLHLDVCALLSMRGDRLVARATGMYRSTEGHGSSEFAIDGAYEIVSTIRMQGELVAADVERDLEKDSPLRQLAEAIGARALLAVPVIFSSHMRTLLVMAMCDGARDWGLEERMIAREASTIISVAQRQGELLDEARRVGEREMLIRQIGRLLRSSLGLDHVLRTAADRIGAALKADHLAIFQTDEAGAMTPLWRFSGGERGEVEQAVPIAPPNVLSAGILEELMSWHSALLAEDGWKSSSTFLGPIPGDERRLVICPIIVRGTIWGLIEIERRTSSWVWRGGELAFVSEMAEQLATAIHQAQLFEQVLRSQHEWESTFDGLADAVMIYDASRIVRRTNMAAASMLNKPLVDLVGERCCDIGFCGEAAACAVQRAIQLRDRVVLEILSPRTYHVLHVTVDPILGEDGQVMGAVQLVRDLDDLRRTEAELRRQQHFLVNLVESANDAIFVIDLAGRLVWSNSHLTGLTGRLISEMLGKPYSSFVSEDQREEFDMHFQAASLGDTRRFEATILNTSNGEERRIVMTYSPIYEENTVVSVLGVARDVTEEKSIAERSQQADKLRALGQLASGVAHDVNNDLAAILGRVQRLMRNPDFVGLRHDLEVIETAALDSAQTVRRIQNFARQQGQADFGAIDLNGLLRDAIEITRTRWLDDAQSRGIKYTVELTAAEIPAILGDGSQLREVFVNLIINALDAMPEGGSLHVESSTDGHAEVHVRFADEGMGIPRRIRERIFEPFFSTKGASGTGMGLAVSYGIVTRHNGRIDVESEVGRGAVFTISFPVTEVETTAAPERRSIEIGPLTVLVIDDEEVVREVLAELLDEQGHTVIQAESGAAGMLHLGSGAFDVVFTDLSMPEMDGWAVARVVRREHPRTKVVLVTGYGAETASPKDEPNLVDAVIGKPFEFNELADLLQRLYE